MSMFFIINEKDNWMTRSSMYLVIADAIKEHLDRNDPLDKELSIMLEEASEIFILRDFTTEMFNRFCLRYREAMEKFPDSDHGINVKKHGNMLVVMALWGEFFEELKKDPRYVE